MTSKVRTDEAKRLHDMFEYEAAAWESGCSYVCGIDEAGRGPLAGPVVAACVVFEGEVILEYLNDSKKVTEKRRNVLFEEIKSTAKAYGIGMASEDEIDKINILEATKLAMKRALDDMGKKTGITPCHLLIDAVKLADINITQESIIKGDEKSASIAAASILAKVTRDRIMEELDREYPQYGFAKHKGYGTKQHREMLLEHGHCLYHRRSFIGKILNP